MLSWLVGEIICSSRVGCRQNHLIEVKFWLTTKLQKKIDFIFYQCERKCVLCKYMNISFCVRSNQTLNKIEPRLLGIDHPAGCVTRHTKNVPYGACWRREPNDLSESQTAQHRSRQNTTTTWSASSPLSWCHDSKVTEHPCQTGSPMRRISISHGDLFVIGTGRSNLSLTLANLCRAVCPGKKMERINYGKAPAITACCRQAR